MIKYSIEEIKTFVTYFHNNPDKTYQDFFNDNYDKQYSKDQFLKMIDSIRKRLQRDKIFKSIKINDSSGLFVFKKHFDLNKLYKIYNIII